MHIQRQGTFVCRKTPPFYIDYFLESLPRPCYTRQFLLQLVMQMQLQVAREIQDLS